MNEKGKPETSLSPSGMEKREHRKKARIRRAWIAIAALLIFVLSSLMALNMTEQNTLAFAHPLETIQHFLMRDGEIPAPSSGGREEKKPDAGEILTHNGKTFHLLIIDRIEILDNVGLHI